MKRLVSVCISILVATVLIILSPQDVPAGGRTFEVVYTVEARGIPQGSRKVRVWVPYPPDDRTQTILDMEIDSPAPFRVGYDKRWGNRMIYFEPDPAGGTFGFSMRLVVERRELSADLDRDVGIEAVDRDAFSLYLEPSRLAVHDARVKSLSAKAAGGRKGIIARARAVYDFVLRNMDYDKNVPGWGRGDVRRVCVAIAGGGKGTGNCTDFHSFFTSLLQIQSIPVVFEMGIPIGAGSAEARGGYHCWASFFLPGSGWVPVDISEAEKNPSMRDYYFGSIDADRLLFSRGRDIVLEPPQSAGPLNYFGPDPYIEVDGRPFSGFIRRVRYRDLSVAP